MFCNSGVSLCCRNRREEGLNALGRQLQYDYLFESGAFFCLSYILFVTASLTVIRAII